MRAKKPSRRRSPRASRRGVALILVLGALTILTVMLTEAQDESSADFSSALAARDQLVAEYAAKSAVNLSRLIIASEPTIRAGMFPILAMLNGGKSPGQIPIWAHADKALGAFNDEDGQKAFSALASIDTKVGKNLGMEGAGFEVQIIDEDSKIDVNAPARGDAFTEIRLASQLLGLMNGPQYDPLFSQRDSDGQFSDRTQICSAIIDWVDPNQDQAVCDPNSTTAQAAAPEDSFYSLLSHPYERKNAGLDSLEELRRVRGMSEDFWSTFVDPDPDNPDKRVVTVWGQGAVNVNTANPQIILAVVCNPANGAAEAPVCTDPAQSANFLMALSMVRGFTAGAPIFGSPKAFVNAIKGGNDMFGAIMKALQIEPMQLKSEAEFLKAITTESKVFSIYATGYVRQGKRETRSRIHAVVDFRDAPPPGMDARALGATKDALETQANLEQQNGVTGAAGTALQQIDAVLKPSPGGTIVYYRVD
jgi:general secretion pathway protein K